MPITFAEDADIKGLIYLQCQSLLQRRQISRLKLFHKAVYYTSGLQDIIIKKS